MDNGVSKKLNHVKERIRRNRNELERLRDLYIKECGPKGYPTTGYHKGKQNTVVQSYIESDLLEEIARIEDMVYIDAHIVESLQRKIDIDKRLEEIDNTEDKIIFLRKVMKMQQEETANKIGISVRTVQRIEKKIKEERG